MIIIIILSRYFVINITLFRDTIKLNVEIITLFRENIKLLRDSEPYLGPFFPSMAAMDKLHLPASHLAKVSAGRPCLSPRARVGSGRPGQPGCESDAVSKQTAVIRSRLDKALPPS